ncbi:pectinesterase-like [Wolffia australiana]
MAKILLLGCLLGLLYLLEASLVTNAFPITSCRQLPYPDACYSIVRATPLLGEEKSRLGFRQMNLQGAVLRAQRALKLASGVNLALMDARTRAAWADCIELAEDTVRKLNKSLASSTADDELTWLSATLANQETCLNGFKELNLLTGASDMPFISTNVSRFLSNSLAVTQSSAGGSGRRLLSRGFPVWVSAGDRKLLQSSAVIADLTVAQDGTGSHKTISEAIAAASKLRKDTSKRFVIWVKAGVYQENVEVPKSMKNLMMIGDGIDSTVVTGSRNVIDGSTTFRSATFAVVADGFIARDMTFENTAGPEKHQAVALRSGADLSVFYRCSFKGYQDTLYVHSQRQFYRDCDIYGTVDFIFGDSVTVLQNCNIRVRKPMSNQKNIITAQGRSDPNENTGISIHNSRVSAAEDLGDIKTFLGRPWKEYSRTVFMKCTLDSLIDPAGWLEWSGSFALNTLYYGEYQNTGDGAGTSGRVKWEGYRVITSAAEAEKFTVDSFLEGGSWLPSSGVPFSPRL